MSFVTFPIDYQTDEGRMAIHKQKRRLTIWPFIVIPAILILAVMA